MFDAEIAAKLLNRWNRSRGQPEGHSALALLHEGKLHFKHGSGDVRAADPAADRCLSIEWLTFSDGSRALRVAVPNEQGGWSPWTATEPIEKHEMCASDEYADVA
ncbi:MAG: hypothetical protein JO371_06560 [Paraburkholderia sp.]|nr:hypothetical protein [Paraburkholderia sp.]